MSHIEPSDAVCTRPNQATFLYRCKDQAAAARLVAYEATLSDSQRSDLFHAGESTRNLAVEQFHATKHAIKHDTDKLSLDLLPFDALQDVAKVLQFGADKYGAHNWASGVSYRRYYAAALRHLFAWFTGQDNDDETGLSHLSHAACCILFLISYMLRNKKEFDDRPLTNQVTTAL